MENSCVEFIKQFQYVWWIMYNNLFWKREKEKGCLPLPPSPKEKSKGAGRLPMYNITLSKNEKSFM